MEGDYFLYLLFFSVWGVGVDVYFFGYFWVGFFCYYLVVVMKFVFVVVNCYNVY